MKHNTKVYLAIVFAIVVGTLFMYTSKSTEQLLASHGKVIHLLNDIDLYGIEIKEQVVNSAFLLYGSNDNLYLTFADIYNNIEKLHNIALLQKQVFNPMMQKLDNLNQQVVSYEKVVQKFLTLNSTIKNSKSQIPVLSTRFLKKFGDEKKEYLLLLSQVTSTIFLSHNAMDLSLLEDIDENIRKMQDYHFIDKEKTRFNNTFLSHIKVFARYMPQYEPVFKIIINNKMNTEIHAIASQFLEISNFEKDRLSLMSQIAQIAFILSIMVIIVLLFNAEKRRLQLQGLHAELEKRATTHSVTGLQNRFALEHDATVLNDFHTLILVNIDGFSDINDFYGKQAGDDVLCRVSRLLSANRIAIKHKFRIYHINADHFSLLLPRINEDEAQLIGSVLVASLESETFAFNDVSFKIKVSVGISQVDPLLETADVVLKQVKTSRKKVMIYDQNLDLLEELRKNLATINLIHEAIEQDRVVPHFMPLMSNIDNRIMGYECLMRIEKEDGDIVYPGEFLEVAKRAKLYGRLTCIMFEKSMATLKNADQFFSFNLSIEDILDDEVIEMIFDYLEESPGLGERIIFELLESEGISNYDIIKDFVIRAKSFGCQIAIDDYGSGYSNLQHLLNLQIDRLKIDGSLIAPIHEDEKNRIAVRAIVDMAHKLGIKSVIAEFVSKEEVFEAVCELGIDYSQGYYIGQATPQLSETAEFLR